MNELVGYALGTSRYINFLTEPRHVSF